MPVITRSKYKKSRRIIERFLLKCSRRPYCAILFSKFNGSSYKLQNGQLYSLDALLQYIKTSGDLRCPVTRDQLSSHDIFQIQRLYKFKYKKQLSLMDMIKKRKQQLENMNIIFFLEMSIENKFDDIIHYININVPYYNLYDIYSMLRINTMLSAVKEDLYYLKDIDPDRYYQIYNDFVEYMGKRLHRSIHGIIDRIKDYITL